MTESRHHLKEASELDSRTSAARPTPEDRPIGRRREDRIVGASHVTQQMMDQATSAARSSLPILLSGPQGSGKLHLARAIHAWSQRANGPFVVMSVVAAPDNVQQHELFGGANGADTSAGGSPEGAMAAAAGGTLVIHDIDLLGNGVRSALIHALESGSYFRAGESQPSALEARVITTTQSERDDLLGEVARLTLNLPSLSDRVEDVLPLAAHFLAIFAEEAGVKPIGFTADARRWLVDEPWRGNVRELRERIRQAVRLAGNGAISAEALMLATEGDEVPSFKEAKRAFETRYVEGLLRRCGGNISRAARLAKKDRKDFYDVIRRTGVDPTQFRS